MVATATIDPHLCIDTNMATRGDNTPTRSPGANGAFSNRFEN